jgi:hypothetical protein
MPGKLMVIGIMFALVCVNGCGAASNVRLSNMESSKTAYMRCLEQNPDDPSKCAALRQAYEADLRAFRDTSKGLTRGGLFSND